MGNELGFAEEFKIEEQLVIGEKKVAIGCGTRMKLDIVFQIVSRTGEGFIKDIWSEVN